MIIGKKFGRGRFDPLADHYHLDESTSILGELGVILQFY